MKKSIIDRFWKKVIISDGCWEWTGYKTKKGYGNINTGNGKMIRVHRFSWEIHNGLEIPDGLVVCHHCDNPSCVNPHHLFVGTQQENVADMISKGRNYILEKHTFMKSKISKEDVIKIRTEYSEGFKNGLTYLSLAKQYGIGETQVYRIVKRKSWEWV